MVDRHLDPSDLESFVTIVTFGSLAAAAAELGVSQPGLSKCVRRLERQLGTPLLIRSARGVSPTSTGEHLLHQAQHVLAELDAARRTLRELVGGGVGRVAVGISPSLATHLIPDLCAKAQRQRPLLTLHVVEGLYEELLIGLRQGRIDLLLSTPPSEAMPVAVCVEDLGWDVFAAFANNEHPLAKTQRIEGDALHHHPWVLAPSVGALRNRFRSLFEQQGFTPPLPYVETYSISLCRSLVSAHGFLTFLPRGLLCRDVTEGNAVELATPWLQWQRRLCLLTLEHRNVTPACEYVRQIVRELAASHLNPSGPAVVG